MVRVLQFTNNKTVEITKKISLFYANLSTTSLIIVDTIRPYVPPPPHDSFTTDTHKTHQQATKMF